MLGSIKDAKIVDGKIILFFWNGHTDEKEIQGIYVSISEDIKDVSGVSRITSLRIEADSISDNNILQNLATNLYNKLCSEEFFGSSAEQERNVKTVVSNATGVNTTSICIE